MPKLPIVFILGVDIATLGPDQCAILKVALSVKERHPVLQKSLVLYEIIKANIGKGCLLRKAVRRVDQKRRIGVVGRHFVL